LDNNIGRLNLKFLEQGYHIAITNSIAMFEFRSKDNPLMEVMESLPANFDDSEELLSNNEFFCHAGNDDHEGKDAKDLNENPRSDEQGNKDDQEQPDSEEKEEQSLLVTPKIKDSSKLSPTILSNTSPLDSECSLDRPIESPLRLSPNSFPQNTSSTYPTPKASGSPTSSMSTQIHQRPMYAPIARKHLLASAT
jgi:hypothetical protein